MTPGDMRPAVDCWGGSMPSAMRDLAARHLTGAPYYSVMPLARAKRFHADAAAADLCGFAVVRAEDDHGREVFIATRGAETLRFRTLAQVDAWVDHLIELRAAGRLEETHAPAR